MPLDFRIEMELTAGPFHLKGENLYTCRESMIGFPAYLIYCEWEKEVNKKYPNIRHELSWFFEPYCTSDCRYVPYIMYENEITDVTCTLWVRSHFALDLIKRFGKTISERYDDVLFDLIEMEDGFTAHSYPGVIFYSTSVNAIGALWWMVLIDRLVFRATIDVSECTISDLIKNSNINDSYIWYSGDTDKDMHLRLWENRHNEIPVSEWIISSTGPCLGEYWATSIRSDAKQKVDFIKQQYAISNREMTYDKI